MSTPASDPPESGPPGSGPPVTPSGTARRWLAPLLVASVAVNLVIIGAAVSGHVWSEHGGRKGFDRSTDLMPRSFFRELDEERRHELVEVFRARKPEFRTERGALGDAASGLADALEREPFDPELAQSAIAEHTARSHRLIDLGAMVARELVATLTPEERRALAAMIRHRLEERRERHKHRSR